LDTGIGFTQCSHGEKKFNFFISDKNTVCRFLEFSFWKKNFELRHDQRAFLLPLTGGCSAKSPHIPPGSFRKKRVRHERHFYRRMIGGLSACGSATVVQLRLRSRRLSTSASLSRSPNRRPKP
jgi:hypothetical protein